jgi:hypothetical protein
MCGRIVFFETVTGHQIPIARIIQAVPTLNGEYFNVQVDSDTPEGGWETVYPAEWERARALAER